MARPKKTEGQADAYERLRQAFWSELKEKPFERITVTEVTRIAQVNHNTFYYYFNNLEDMLRKLLKEVMPPNFGELLIPALLDPSAHSDGALIVPDIESRFQELCILIRGASPSIESVLRSAAIQNWLGAMQIEVKDLDEEEYTYLVFIFGGLFSLIKENKIVAYQDVVEIINGAIGQLGRTLLRTIMEKNAKNPL